MMKSLFSSFHRRRSFWLVGIVFTLMIGFVMNNLFFGTNLSKQQQQEQQKEQEEEEGNNLQVMTTRMNHSNFYNTTISTKTNFTKTSTNSSSSHFLQQQQQEQQKEQSQAQKENFKFENQNENESNNNSNNNNKMNNNKDDHHDHHHDRPLNIVLFYADDWTFSVLGTINRYVYTPHLDQLTKEGILFQNSFVTTSVCWMSRATLVTGTYASRHLHVKAFSQQLFHTHDWKQTLFPLLKQQRRSKQKQNQHDTTTTSSSTTGGTSSNIYNYSYFTGCVGKWHAPTPTNEMNMAFDYTNLYYKQHWLERNGQLRHITELNQEDALEFLQTYKERYNNNNNNNNDNNNNDDNYNNDNNNNDNHKKYFALKVSFFATHSWQNHYPSYNPMEWSKEYYNYNKNQDDNSRNVTDAANNITNNTHNNNTQQKYSIPPRPKTATEEHWKSLPPFLHNENNMGRHEWKKRWEEDYYQESIINLYRMATEVDAAIGNIIQEIKQQGLYNDTFILFTTDNGDLHGEHGLAEKWYPFEESIRVPLIIRDPRMPKQYHGTIDKDHIVLNIDLAPTLLGAAQIPQSSFMQGRNLADLYLQQENNDDDNDNDNENDEEESTSSTSSLQNNNNTNSNVNNNKKVALDWRRDFFYEYNNGHPKTAEGHDRIYSKKGGYTVDASFALINNEWKYIYWPQQLPPYNEQLFHRSVDIYDEYDLLLLNSNPQKNQHQNQSQPLYNDTTTNPNNNSMNHHHPPHHHHDKERFLQTTQQAYEEMKERFWELKQLAQDGHRV